MKVGREGSTIRRMTRWITLGLIVMILSGSAIASSANAQTTQAAMLLTPTAAIPSPHFRLPLEGPPGPATWYVIQFYGNTPAAYLHRNNWYDQGQGLHFGVDFATRCGTSIVAIGDGQVIEVDNLSHGAAPHNLSILHPDGYVSFYGHLLETPKLNIGDDVKQGQPIALTGDPDLTCRSRPHLHLEIRDKTMGYAYNPVTLIDADWDTLALFGAFRKFSRNLDNPRQWVSPFDQPMVDFGGPLLNDYAHPWPPKDW